MPKKRLLLTFASILAAFILAGSVLAAAGASTGSAGFPPVSQIQPPGEGPLPEGKGPWVVRAYFTDPELVKQLSVQLEPWEVQYAKGYLVARVDAAQYLWMLGLGFRLEVDQALTDEYNRPLALLPGQTTGIPGFPCYRTVEETYASAQDLVIAYPNLAEWVDIGDSWEKATPGGDAGYDLKVLRLTNALTPGPKPALFIMGSIHAREYAAAELATRFGEYLLSQYDVDPDITWLLDYQEIHLLLQANPDGRKRAETGLAWRKNTDNNYCGGTNSRGIDLNRNYAFQWGCCGGSSSDPCSEIFRGPSPASEPETQAVQAYMRSIFPDQRADPLTSPAPPDATGVFIDLHSYGRLVLWPWGFTSTVPPNGPALQTLGRKFAFFNGYEPGQSIGLYPTDGTTDDFIYGDLGVAGYTLELGTAFFQNCSSFENTIVPDNLPALLVAAKAARTPYLTPAGPDVRSPAAIPSAAASGGWIQLSGIVDDTRFDNSAGSEPTQNITAAEYYVDIPPWDSANSPVANPMSASDGSFNASIEAVRATLNTTGLSHGRHTVFMRGQDANGSWGAVSAVFIYVLDPDVAPTIQGFVREQGNNLPLSATVSAGSFQTVTDPSTGFYSMLVFSGTYDMSAAALDHAAASAAGVHVQDYETRQQDFFLTPICSIFSDDVEGGNIGWTATAPWAITTESAHSPSHSWTDSPGGNYTSNRNVSLTSPVINLSGVSNVSLEFWHTYATESNFDFAYVESSTNGGSTWTIEATYDGTQSQWTPVSLSLPALDGQANARIRFRFTSDSSQVADGWHIDDIALRGSGPACITQAAPVAEFTSNSPVVVGQALQLSNLTGGSAPLEYFWDFGDGAGTSTQFEPTYAYDHTGFFNVTLTATNTLGSDSASHTVEVQPCVAATAITLTQVSTGTLYIGDLVDFSIDLAPDGAHKPYTYTLSFDDGSPPLTASSSADPVVRSHAFLTAGDHTVGAEVQNLCMPAPVSDSVVVPIAVRHGSTISPSTSVQFGDPGEVVSHTLRLTNIGDTPDTFTLTLGAAAWDTTLSSSSLTLGPGSAADFNVRVQVPFTAVSGDEDRVQLTSTSSFPGTAAGGTEMTTSASAVYGVHVLGVPHEQTGNPGETLPFDLIIENTGNANDIYDIVVNLSAWPAVPDQTSTIIPYGETRLVDVDVTIPAHSSGQSNVSFLTITSHGDPTVQFEVVLITHASWRIQLPVILK